MALYFLSGTATQVSLQENQYRFMIGQQEVVLTSKIPHCISESDEVSLVGYYFNDEKDEKIMGVVAYFNHHTRAKSSNKIPLYTFILAFILNIGLLTYVVNLYLIEVVSYPILLLIILLLIPIYLGFTSIEAHLKLQSQLKNKSLILKTKG